MAQYVKVKHHTEKYHHGKNDKILHGIAESLVSVTSGSLVLREYEWLVGKPERLDEHHHHNSYLVVGSVNTHLSHGIGSVGNKPRQ